MVVGIIKKIVKKHIIYPVWFCLNKYIVNHQFYENINLDITNVSQKRVLISYITTPLEIDISSFKITHTNILEANIIYKFFIDNGYVIDIIHCKNTININKIKSKKYDVVFGFGNPFYLACKLNNEAKKIIYLTELAPDLSKENEDNRIEYFKKRHKEIKVINRSGVYYENKHIFMAKYGLFFGNRYTSQMYMDKFPDLKIFNIEPTGFCNKKFQYRKKNYELVKKNFIWFGSHGAIHKGLDLLLDVFKEIPNANLFICGLSEKENSILRKYKLYKNIINLGFIDVQSDEFINLINNVAFVILPSAAEGMATSVLTCMRHGLIPIVTRETGIDVENIGIYLYDYKVDYIKDLINKIILYTDKEVEEMNEKVFLYSKNRFSLLRFKTDFGKLMSKILSEE